MKKVIVFSVMMAMAAQMHAVRPDDNDSLRMEQLQEVVVKGVWVQKDAPFAVANIKKKELQDFAKTAPINIVLVGNNEKQKMAELQHYAAGAASQNIYLYCAQAGLKTVVRYGCDREKLAQAMKLDDKYTILYVQTVGK